METQTGDKYAKLRGKYERAKAGKKELERETVVLRGVMAQMRVRESKYEEIVELLKEKRTKICMCHVNKLEKMLAKEEGGSELKGV